MGTPPSIGIDGLLINAGALVIGTTNAQVAVMPMQGFSYYHVETDAHELILAEGVACESYLDVALRGDFTTHAGTPGADVIAEMDRPRISAARLVPEKIRARLAARAQAVIARPKAA